MPSATARCRNAPGINASTLKAKGFTDEPSPRSKRPCRPRSTSSSPSTSGRFGEDFIRDQLGIGAEAIAAPGFDLLAAIGFTKREIEAANVHICGAMTVEGAPHLKAEHYRGVRLRQPLRQDRQALSLGREPHPHDGGVAAVHLGCDLQDHQHAERRHGGGLQVRLPAVLEARAEGQRALPRRLEAVASRSTRSSSPTRTTRTMRVEALPREADGGARRAAVRSASSRRSSSASS